MTMSKPTWEEEIEDRLDTILKELKNLQDMMGTLMVDSKTPPKTQTQIEKPRTVTPKRKTQEDKTETTAIRDLKPGDKSSKEFKINIEGTLIYDPVQRDVNTSKGTSTVTNILVSDRTGELKLAFWGKSGDPVMNLVKGDRVRLDNVWLIKDPYDGVLQAESGEYCKVTQLED